MTTVGTLDHARALLDRLGLGELDPGDGESPPGRNDNHAGTTSTGHRVFVKRLRGGRPEAVRRFGRLRRFEETVAAGGRPPGLPTPACLGWDEDALVVAWEWLGGARSGHDLAAAGEFDEDLARTAGHMIGTLHSLAPERDPDPAADQAADPAADPPRLPPVALFDHLPLDYFTEASGACLEGWRMLQPDTGLAAALRDLRARESRAPRTPAHCDLRLDQFLRFEGRLHLCDWEEFRPADPARDVGAFAGEWLYRAVLEVPSQEDDGPDGDPARAGSRPLSHQEVVARGVRELARLRTRTAAFWDGYRRTRPAADPGLAVRAAAFAGWHLIDRMFAAAETRPALTAVDRAAAGIGRSAVLHPEKFTAALGLEA
ncbi:class V lanthionine synthetase subunit LxmK [Streptomyces sp. MAR4 CNX-425]|uniref:class V lanthionine synthetase subunit LxmK n=1 Tax=Streptomyces sp. MAR4 CNX-425 TaxID=3406343 RepID=UPI003B50C2FB